MQPSDPIPRGRRESVRSDARISTPNKHTTGKNADPATPTSFIHCKLLEILADMRMDHQSLMAAMLHDVIEDTGIAKDALQSQFGEAVAELVDGVSKLTHISFETRAEAQAENFQKMTLAMARDIRVIIVKLADRLHNMRTIGSLNPEKRRRIATRDPGYL